MSVLGPDNKKASLRVDSEGRLIVSGGGGGGGGGSTDLGLGTRTNTTLVITSSSGGSVTVPAANSTQAGLISAASQNKLDGIDVAAAIAAHAAAADPHPQYTTAAELAAALAGKADIGHTHVIANITGLQAALDGKEAAGTGASAAASAVAAHLAESDPHSQYATDVALASGLAGKADVGHTHNVIAGITITGTPAPGQVLKATSTSAASWAADETGGGGGGGSTNLGNTPSPTGITVTSSSGTGTTLPLADSTNAGLQSPAQNAVLANLKTVATSGAYSDLTGLPTLGSAASQPTSAFATAAQGTDAREWSAATVTQAEAEAGSATVRVAWTVQRVWQAINAWWAGSAMKTKLDGIDTGATANSSDTFLRNRANHTGTQAISTITDLQATLNNLAQTGGVVQATSNVTVDPSTAANSLFNTGSTSRAFTINTNSFTWFRGFTVDGPCTFVAGSGVTIDDRRQTGLGFAHCQVVRRGDNSYRIVGSAS